jgi:hypothetical protein
MMPSTSYTILKGLGVPSFRKNHGRTLRLRSANNRLISAGMHDVACFVQGVKTKVCHKPLPVSVKTAPMRKNMK